MIQFRVGDVRGLLAELPAGSVDLIAGSWPYLAQRSYLPADHPMKALEIGQESTPAEFISTLLEVTAGFRRVLAPHGSIATELGDGFSGSGGAGGDYNANGLREGQAKYDGSGRRKQTLGWSECGCASGCRPTTWRWEVTEVIQGREPGGKWYAVEFFDEPPAETRVKRTRVKVVDEIGTCADRSHWRPGLVLDPFGGSGTTGMVAAGNGRDCLMFDLDARCVDLARERLGLYLDELAHPQPEPAPPVSEHEQEAML